MPLLVFDAANMRRTVAGAGDKRRRRFSAGFVWSVLLHGCALAAFAVALGRTAESFDVFVPLTIIALADETAGPVQPNQAPVPERKAGPASAPAARPAGLDPAKNQPAPNSLDLKLRKLAELRQPLLDRPLADRDNGVSRTAGSPADARTASYATVRDFLRAQIERRWSPDLAILHGRNFVVLIRVEITKAGAVTRADIVNDSGLGAEDGYVQIAASARNAILLSSPLNLPPGHYPEVMELVLKLNTRETLR